MAGQEDLIVITGPTCSGKTGLVLRLALDHPIEVISADSMQVYRHMDIATAKPTARDLSIAVHHIIDVVNPDQEFQAAMFVSMAREKIAEVRARGGIPVVVGGTGLYIKALVHGLAPAPGRSEEIRKVLRNLIARRGMDHLERMLLRLDPEAAEGIRKNDAIRTVRSLEIILLSGQKASAILAGHGFRQRRYEALTACIMPDRERLFPDIDRRTARMVDDGLLEETARILSLGYGPELRSMQTLAYKHVISHFRSAIDLDECIRLIQRDTRRFAKRQITWMKGRPDQTFFPSADTAYETVSMWLERTGRKWV
ncbi:MAG TPA: tRNA (adenosine(37)-N6)-dimethylallyltransferase MiaA [Deltaproteobacteria bacterium]|nr:tRNA (adenosine(37)-N6)-dimethylallyltransferase MiaA [Deltaproteobacteria bacterium]HPR53571.1 tRNA (adenosine(37)-N6)-dimethylallyltransferase MiaA [Deltaproteobacteria bacterium]HXK47638.1 tRNA (adenosine(37)-N6)-dimethylallyltransferase MiaA [Deltaproteobacteria bacterium]